MPQLKTCAARTLTLLQQEASAAHCLLQAGPNHRRANYRSAATVGAAAASPTCRELHVPQHTGTMAGRVYLEMAYVAPRAALWAALFVLALVDGVRHRAVRSRGWAGEGDRGRVARSGRQAGCGGWQLVTEGMQWLSMGWRGGAILCKQQLPFQIPTADPHPHPLASCPSRCSYQLFWALVGSSALFVLQEVVLVILVADSSGQASWDAAGKRAPWLALPAAALAPAHLCCRQKIAPSSRSLHAWHPAQSVNRATLGAYIFFADLATSYWFGILLAVAAGYW